MPVRKQVMGAGDWEIRLDRDGLPVPQSVTADIDLDGQAFGHVFVLPARVHVETLTDADLYAQAVYTGVYRVQQDRTTIRGAHVSSWMGDEDGNGPRRQANGYISGSLSTWVAGLGAASRLILGTVTSPGGTLTWTCTWPDTLSCLNYVCRYFGVEWQVTDDLVLNVGSESALYGSADPTTICTPWWNGRDNLISGLRATIGVEKSVEGFYNVARAQSAHGTPDETSTIPGGAFYRDGGGTAFAWYRQVFDDGGSDLLTLANQMFAESGYPSRLLSVHTDAYCPMVDVECGSTVYVHDPVNNVYGVNDQAYYAGQLLPVARARVYGLEMVLRQGMGIVFRAGNGALTDLSDYVAWETGQSTLDVDRRHAPLSKVMDRSVLGR